MRLLLIGATGTIGRAIGDALAQHDLILASQHKAHERVDIADPASLRARFDRVGTVDGIISAAASAAWKPLADLTDADFAFSLANKLMGQANVVSPPWVSETLEAMGQSPDGGMRAAVVAKSYVQSVQGSETGTVIAPTGH